MLRLSKASSCLSQTRRPNREPLPHRSRAWTVAPCDAGPVNPAQKKVLFGALAAIFGALATYFAAGCTPAQIQHVESAADREIAKGACVKAVVERYDDLLADPLRADLEQLLAFKADVSRCVKPTPKPSADAGVR